MRSDQSPAGTTINSGRLSRQGPFSQHPQSNSDSAMTRQKAVPLLAEAVEDELYALREQLGDGAFPKPALDYQLRTSVSIGAPARRSCSVNPSRLQMQSIGKVPQSASYETSACRCSCPTSAMRTSRRGSISIARRFDPAPGDDRIRCTANMTGSFIRRLRPRRLCRSSAKRHAPAIHWLVFC